MSETLVLGVTLLVGACPTCGAVYGLSRAMYDDRHNKGGHFFCPNGDKLSWPVSEVERLRRVVVAKDARIDQLAADRDHRERQARAARGQVTRIKNRIANGVCPCCERSFRDVARHMKSKHPEFTKEDA